MLKTGQHFSLHSGPSASTRFIHQVCMNKLILWATRQCFLIQASLMMTLWVVLREIPSTTRLLVMKRTLLSFVSSISRQRRWSRCTSLIVRPKNNSQGLYGSYQVSSRHNSSQLLYVVLFFFGFLCYNNITTATVSSGLVNGFPNYYNLLYKSVLVIW